MVKPIKKTKTKLERLIRTVWHQTRRGSVVNTDEQSYVVSAIRKTLDYFEMDDYLNGRNSMQIYELIYLSSDKKISKIKSVTEIPYSEPTIARYCDRFIKAFEKCLDRRKVE